MSVLKERGKKKSEVGFRGRLYGGILDYCIVVSRFLSLNSAKLEEYSIFIRFTAANSYKFRWRSRKSSNISLLRGFKGEILIFWTVKLLLFFRKLLLKVFASIPSTNSLLSTSETRISLKIHRIFTFYCQKGLKIQIF